MLHSIAYQRVTFNYPHVAAELLSRVDSARDIYENRNSIGDMLPEISPSLSALLSADWSAELQRAQEELAWCERNNISVLVPGMEAYPQRLLSCPDYPVALYYRGTADLNAAHIVSVVGTRKSTSYGHDFLKRFVADLHEMFPDVIVVSGLAYGIDICAHREALQTGTDTVGVLAHGLDTMYPAAHRGEAAKMLKQGGLITEYISKTPGERQNFLRRNRIVAGLADCTLIVESMAHGGSLVTANMAQGYAREVMALPGNINNKASEGCNNLIHKHAATLITSAQDVANLMGWQTETQKSERRKKAVELELFHDFTDEQKRILSILRSADTQINVISSETQLPVSRISAILFELEMKGIVKPLAGGMYHLIML